MATSTTQKTRVNESIKLPPRESSELATELARRETCQQKLEAFLKSRPTEWIPMRELADVGGIGGWRTRLSELALRKTDPLRLEWNGKSGAASCHRYLPWEPLGPDSADRDRPATGFLFRL